MLTTSSGFSSVVNSSYRVLKPGILMSWTKSLASNISFFTVNTSLIGGNDIIPGTSNTSVSFFDKYQYLDYTSYTQNWSVDRQIGQFPFGMIMAQADIQLNNTSNLFSPNFDATIGSGILPNRPLKINMGMGVDSLPQFTGFTGQPNIDIAQRTMTLHAFDVVDYLNNYSFTSQSGITFSGMLTNVTTASAIQYYLGQLGFNANQYSLEKSLNSAIGVVNVTDRKFGDVLNDLVEAEQGILQADETGIIQFWNRQHFVTTSGLGFLFNLNKSNCINIQYSNAPIINDVTVIAKPRAVGFTQQVWKQPIAQTLPAGQTTSVFADFSDDNGPLPATRIDIPTFQTGAINASYYTTNMAADGTGSVTNTGLTISTTYLFGTTYRMDFVNSGVTTLYIIDMVLYGTPARVTNTFTQRYTDQNSIDAYGRNPSNNGNTLEIQNDYIQSDSDALALGFTIVSQFGQPNKHFTVETFSDPSRQIGDYGKLTLPDTGITKTVWITGKTDKQAPEGNLTQILQLEERTLFTYFTINTSVIGGTDVIAP